MSPKEFNALLSRWNLEQERRDLRSGILAAIVANMFLKKGRRPFKPVDFMAHKGEHSGVVGGEPIKVPWQKQLKIVERLNAMLHGRDLRRGVITPNKE